MNKNKTAHKSLTDTHTQCLGVCQDNAETVRYVIPGKPIGKARPRFRNSHVYTPEKTQAYEQLSKTLYRAAAKGVFFDKGTPVRIFIEAHFPIPESASKKQKQSMASGKVMHMSRPDADNIAKIILDSLNKTAFYDDAQLVDVRVQKRYGTEPCVIVTVEKYKEITDG